MPTREIDGLRATFRSLCATCDREPDRAADFQELVQTYYSILVHPDLTWGDLLMGLGVPGTVAAQAALRLHARLGDQHGPSGLIMDIGHWEGRLAALGIRATGRVSAQTGNRPS
ncbi:hypothetical protein YTPLAS18_40580 [Nitrospira sp.]|nr:hypothetical protein YTPLAS18_40580 [Nitrospira sp.]